MNPNTKKPINIDKVTDTCQKKYMISVPGTNKNIKDIMILLIYLFKIVTFLFSLFRYYYLRLSSYLPIRT